MMSTRFFLFTIPMMRSRARSRIDSSWLPRHSITRSLGIEESVHKGGEGREGEGRGGTGRGGEGRADKDQSGIRMTGLVTTILVTYVRTMYRLK